MMIFLAALLGVGLAVSLFFGIGLALENVRMPPTYSRRYLACWYEIGDHTYERSREMLKSLLTEKQLKIMNKHGFIPVTGSEGGKWRIYTDRASSSTVRRIRPLKWEYYCGVLSQRGTIFPLHDHHVAQLLAIQLDEKAFKGIAIGPH